MPTRIGSVGAWTATLVLLALTACADDPIASPGKAAGEVCTGAADTQGDCAAGLLCSGGVCVVRDLPCKEGATSCDDQGNVVRCEEGTSQLVRACAAGCRDGDCLAHVCLPSDRRCEDDTLLRCNDHGTQWAPEQVCALGCDPLLNACIESTCAPGSRRCNDLTGEIETCTRLGDAWESSACEAGICLQEGTGAGAFARCQPDACVPGEVRCEGSLVVQCGAGGDVESVVQACPGRCEDAMCVTRVCEASARRCSLDGRAVEFCQGDGAAWTAIDCSDDGTSVCRHVPGSTGVNEAKCVRTVCTPGALECRGDRQFRCNEDGTSESVEDVCTFGCGDDGQCLPPACDAGQSRCVNDAIEMCRPDRRGFAFAQYCAAGCLDDATTGGARCAIPTCSPFVARCAGNAVERCRPDGRGWQMPESCAITQTCTDGSCVGAEPACTEGASRCVAGALEVCVGDDDTTAYEAIGACLGSCAGDGCDDAGQCGPFEMRLAGVSSQSLPADGQSTLLVLSDALVGPDGSAVPDGTLVTLSLESAGTETTAAAIVAGDASSTRPGLQVAVFDGRIDFAIRAPAATMPSSTRIRAFIAGRPECDAELVVPFVPGAPGHFHAEDFTTTRNRSSAGAKGTWDTTMGTLTVSRFDAGDGRDGDLVVAAAETVDLSTHSVRGRPFADMASQQVVEIRNNLIAVAGSLDPFAEPGTRLLLINQRGARGRFGAVGTFEYLETSGVQGGYLRTTTPVVRQYSDTGNGQEALADQAVRLYRIPQYHRVTVDGTLTAPAWDGEAGGLLVFFADSTDATDGTSRVSGRIDMSGRGYRGASKPAVYNPTPTAFGGGHTIDFDNAFCSSSPASLPYGHSGEGLEGLRDTVSPVGGPGRSGGGFMCGSGGLAPLEPGRGYVTPNIRTTLYQGSSGSHATAGASTCPTYGPGITYGDSLLVKLYLGGGSGSATRSRAESCFTTRSCCRKYGNSANDCCTAEAGRYHPSPGPVYAGDAEEDHYRDATCLGCVNTAYCDGRSFLYDASYEGAPGGGIVLVTAAALEFTSTGGIDVRGLTKELPNPGEPPTFQPANITALGGAGGTIHLRAGRLSLGTADRLLAVGGQTGGDGRIRVDAVELTDANFNAATWTQPGATFIELDGDTVTSLPVFEFAAGETVHGVAATLLPAGRPIPMDGSGTVLDGPALADSKIALLLSADNGGSWLQAGADAQVTFIPTANAAGRWRISPAIGSRSGAARGLLLKYSVTSP